MRELILHNRSVHESVGKNKCILCDFCSKESKDLKRHFLTVHGRKALREELNKKHNEISKISNFSNVTEAKKETEVASNDPNVEMVS